LTAFAPPPLLPQNGVASQSRATSGQRPAPGSFGPAPLPGAAEGPLKAGLFEGVNKVWEGINRPRTLDDMPGYKPAVDEELSALGTDGTALSTIAFQKPQRGAQRVSRTEDRMMEKRAALDGKSQGKRGGGLFGGKSSARAASSYQVPALDFFRLQAYKAIGGGKIGFRRLNGKVALITNVADNNEYGEIVELDNKLRGAGLEIVDIDVNGPPADLLAQGSAMKGAFGTKFLVRCDSRVCNVQRFDGGSALSLEQNIVDLLGEGREVNRPGEWAPLDYRGEDAAAIYSREAEYTGQAGKAGAVEKPPPFGWLVGGKIV